jgi:RNA polymerase-binding protein DksA
MSRSELAKYREQLVALGKRVRGEFPQRQNEALRQVGGSVGGNLSNIPTHPADIATDAFQQETAVSVLENQEQLLEETEAALQRIEDGTFGKCQECGNDIGSQRLDAVPYTPFCVDCARDLETLTR